MWSRLGLVAQRPRYSRSSKSKALASSKVFPASGVDDDWWGKV